VMPVRSEDLPRIRLDARARRADRNALALQLAETLDARRLERHELAGLRVKGRNPLQALQLFPLEHPPLCGLFRQ